MLLLCHSFLDSESCSFTTCRSRPAESSRAEHLGSACAASLVVSLTEVNNGSAGSEVDNEGSASARGGGKQNKRAVIKISTTDKHGERTAADGVDMAVMCSSSSVKGECRNTGYILTSLIKT